MSNNKEDLPFGRRNGFEPIEIPFQIDRIDKVLRTELWNAYHCFIINEITEAGTYGQEEYVSFYKVLWMHYFKKPIDDFSSNYLENSFFIRRHIEVEEWFKVYEFFEYTFKRIANSRNFNCNHFENYIGTKLKEHNSAYTIIEHKFVPIINQTQIDELKLTQKFAQKYGLNGIQEHLSSALELISLKPKPSLRNSIKESISMVEAISRIIEPKENTLGKALNKLDKANKINVTLKTGFEKLYGYTNDKNGIRHALMNDDTVEIEDAKFFLISCSAFTNYLIEKARKDNLLNFPIVE